MSERSGWSSVGICQVERSRVPAAGEDFDGGAAVRGGEFVACLGWTDLLSASPVSLSSGRVLKLTPWRNGGFEGLSQHS